MSQTPPITAERLDAKTLSEAHDLFADTTEARAAIVRGITDESAQAMTGVEYRLGVFVASHGLSILAAAREAERLRLALNDIEKFRCPPGFDGEGATEFIRAIAIKALKGANP